MSDNNKPTQKLVEVVLVKPHTHADRPRAAGETIKVTEPERDWLAKHQIIQAPTAQKAGEK